MEAVIALLSQSQEESDIMQTMQGQPSQMSQNLEENDDSIIIHQGKKYQKI